MILNKLLMNPKTKCLLEINSLRICHNIGMRHSFNRLEHRLYRMGWKPYASTRKKNKRPKNTTDDYFSGHHRFINKKNTMYTRTKLP